MHPRWTENAWKAGTWLLMGCLVSAFAFMAISPDRALAWKVTSPGEGYAVRIEREEADTTQTATVVLYGTNVQPTAGQLNGSWDTTGAGTWMGTTERARIFMDSNDDCFEWYSSSVSPGLIYVLAHIFDSNGETDAEVVTLGFWTVQPFYLANKPSGAVVAAATSTPVAVVATAPVTIQGTVAADIASMASSVSVDGTLPVNVVSHPWDDLDADGMKFLALGLSFSAGLLSVDVWRRNRAVG